MKVRSHARVAGGPLGWKTEHGLAVEQPWGIVASLENKLVDLWVEGVDGVMCRWCEGFDCMKHRMRPHYAEVEIKRALSSSAKECCSSSAMRTDVDDQKSWQKD